MEISVSEAKASLTELLHRAESGEDVVLTRRGHRIARIVPIKPSLTREQRRALIDEIRAMAPKPAMDDVPAERSQDFLYDDDGMPG
ncbi:type II toxin-antitoxin system prevent-host-death family antitoxin [Rhizobium sp. YS-1r]|uniref:type II toxin-antitoxin system Phd/YefM family antitoxin n=1 Tax=Rhizobium sp. YS-1r TaxID=1532558 RepID=UPI00050E62BD|nr:type II toxin-antitoxin system prevent-host-death family antitoxin [Rhizobium sp. YS-1r]KGD91972.1 prevent-host-death protein [Rhizobium sp. YS-1r]